MNKSAWKRVLPLLLSIVMAIGSIPFGAFSRVVEAEEKVVNDGAFKLTKFTNKGKDNGLQIEWEKPEGDGDYGYLYYQRKYDPNLPDAQQDEFETRSTNYGKHVSVLVINPSAEPVGARVAAPNLENWMKNDVDPGELLKITTVSAQQFSKNVEMLKGEDGKYQYDVLAIGMNNLNGDTAINDYLNAGKNGKVLAAVKAFLESGRGVLFGHDTLFDKNYTGDGVYAGNVAPAMADGEIRKTGTPSEDYGENWMFAPLAGYAGIIQTQKAGREAYLGNHAKIVETGYLIEYPNRVDFDSVLRIGTTHVNASATKGKVWAMLTNANGELSTVNMTNHRAQAGNVKFDYGGKEYQTNFYLSSYKNTIHIQTGHAPGEVTTDERKMLSNCLFFLAQLTFEQNLNDFSATDQKSPEGTDIKLTSTSEDGKTYNVALNAKDRGTQYEGYIKAVNQDGGEEILSDTKRETVVSGTKAYFVLFDNSPSGKPVVTPDKTGVVKVEPRNEGANRVYLHEDEINGANISFDYTQYKSGYMHVIAVDHANNIGEVSTVKVSDFLMGLDVEVVDENDKPVSDAKLSLSGVSQGATDDDGKKRIIVGNLGKYTVFVEADGYDANIGTATLSIDDRLKKVKIVLSKKSKGAIIGQVTDQDDNPLQGAKVRTLSGMEAETDESGFYYILNVEPNTYATIASKTDYNSVPATIKVSAGETVKRDFKLIKKNGENDTVLISGQVTEETGGTGIADVSVVVKDFDPATTDSFGYYIAGPMPPSKQESVDVAGTKHGYKNYSGKAIVKSVDTVHNFAMKKLNGGLITVKVIDKGTKEPVPTATVILGGKNEVANAIGIAEFIDVTFGSHNLLAQAPGYNVNTKTVTVADKQNEQQLTVEIELERGNKGAIYGRVIDADTNMGVRGAIVRSIANDAIRATTDDEGYYVILGVDAGSYTTVVEKEDYNPKKAIVTVSPNTSTEQNFHISKNKTGGGTKPDAYLIYGVVKTIVGKDAKVEPGATVSDGNNNSVTTDSFGCYALESESYAEGSEQSLTAYRRGFAKSIAKVAMKKENIRQDFELTNSMMITIKCLLSGSNAELHTMTFPFSVTEGKFVIEAPYIKGYVTAPGSSKSITIDPDTHVPSEPVVFYYKNNMTTVTVKARYEDGTTAIEGFADIKVAAEIGKPFNYEENPPLIEGYSFLNKQEPIPSVIGDGSDEFYLYYKRQWANTVIKAIDADTEELITTKEMKLESGETINVTDEGMTDFEGIAKEALKYHNLEPDSGYIGEVGTKTYTYNGIGKPPDIVFRYKRMQAEIKFQLMDADSGKEITPKKAIPRIKIGMGLPVEIFAPDSTQYVPGNYSLQPGGESQIVAAMDVSQKNMVVTFLYKKNQKATDIKIILGYYDTGGTELKIINEYSLLGEKGVESKIEAPHMAGWVVVPSEKHPDPGKITPTDDSDKNQIVFIYKRDTVTVNITAVAEADEDITSLISQGSQTIELPKGFDAKVYAPQINGYIAVAHKVSTVKDEFTPGTVAFIKGEHVAEKELEVIFKYQKYDPSSKLTTITVRGLGKNSEELYKYALNVAKNSGEKTVKAIKLAGYELQEKDEVTVTVGEQPETVTFNYNSLNTKVVIEAVLKDSEESVPGFEEIVVTAIKGQSYSYQAPYIAGYNYEGNNVVKELEKVVGDAEKDKITFEYSKSSSNIVKELRENDESGPIIKTESIVMGPGETKDIEATKLDYYVLEGPRIISVTNNNTAQTVIFVYRRQMQGVEIKGIDVKNNSELKTVDAKAHRVGETVKFMAPDIEGYSLQDVTTVSKNVLIEAQKGKKQKVEFMYRSQMSKKLDVKALCDGETIYAYSVDAVDGTELTVNAPVLEGYKLKDDEPDRKSHTVPGAIVFQYEKNTVTVSLALKDYSTLQKIQVPSGEKLAYEVIKGTNGTVQAPHIDGYVIVGSKREDYTKISADRTFTFFYQKLSEAMVQINVRGVNKETNNELYSYTLLKEKKSGALNVGAFKLSGYALDDDTPSPKNVTVADKDLNVTFNYSSLSRTIKVKAMLKGKDGNPDTSIPNFGEIPVKAVKGQSFSYNAPYVSGYNLLRDEPFTKVITEVKEDEEMTFYFEKATGNVIITLKENNNTGRVIRTTSDQLDVGQTKTIPIPKLDEDNYTPISGQTSEEVTNEGKAMYVEYYYSKDTRKVDLILKDESTKETIKTHEDFGSYRIGEVATFNAPHFGENWKLSDSTPKLILIEAKEGNQKVEFNYSTLKQGELNVVSLDEAGGILENSVLEAINGSGISVRAPAIDGYKLISTEDTTKKGTVPGTVTFRYEKNLVKVTVYTKSKNQKIGTSQVHEVTRGTMQTFLAPHVKGYVIDDSHSKTLINPQKDEEIVFNYIPISEVAGEHTVVITVVGKAGEAELYNYSFIKGKNSGETEVKAFKVTGYELKGNDTHSFNVKDVNLSHIFQYESLATRVLIEAVDRDGKTLDNFNPFYVNAVKDQSFSYAAPYVKGYNLDGNTIRTIENVKGTGDKLTFTYNKAEGNVIILLKEDGPNGAIIKSESRILPVGEETKIPVPILSGDCYDPISEAKTVTHDGNPQTVEFYYKKQLGAVVIQPMHEKDKIGTAVTTGKIYRLGEVSSFDAPSVADYALVDSTPKLVKVMEDSQVVQFYYDNATDDQIVVESVYKDTEGKETLINSYVMGTKKDSKVAVNAPKFLGYELAKVSKNSIEATAPEKVKFVYVKNVATVTVKLVEDKTDKPLTEPVGYKTKIEVPKGGDTTIYAPHVSGYAIEGAQNQNFINLQEDKEVKFKYTPISKKVDEHTVVITVVGKAENEELYNYSFIKGKNSGETVVNAFKVAGYELIGDDTHSFDVQETNLSHTFQYESLATEVLIEAVDPDKVPLTNFTPFKVSAVKGQSFSYAAPYVKGYNLDGSTIGNIEKVNGTGDKLTFIYNKAEGNVIILLKEDDANGAIIKSESRILPVGEEIKIPAPDLSGDYYEPISEEKIVTHDGNPQTVEFYYTKQLSDVVILPMYKERVIGTAVLTEKIYRLGEVSSIDALSIEDYALADSTPKLLKVTKDSREVQFNYEQATEGQIVVESFYKNDEGKEVFLNSYVIESKKGVDVTIKAPKFFGYKLEDESKSSITTSAQGRVKFVYVKNVVSVTVKLMCISSKDEIPAPKGYKTLIEVPYNGDVTVYAAHVDNYVLVGDSWIDKQNLIQDETVIFNYVTFEEAASENLVNVEINGMADSTELYSYNINRLKDSGAYKVDALNVSGYGLTGSPTAELDVQGEDIIHSFNYEPLATSVRIEAILADGSQIQEFIPFYVPAIKGQGFSYNAPYIRGYEYVGDGNTPLDMTRKIDAVTGDRDVLSFTYKKSDGNLTVILREQNAGIIQTMSQTLIAGKPTEIEIPQLKYYTALSVAPETVIFEGTPVTVNYEYARDTRTVRVRALDNATGMEIQSYVPTELAYRVGEIHTFSAPHIDGYVLDDTSQKVVFLEEGMDILEVDFRYKEPSEDEVAVVAVYNGEITFTYSMKTTVGANVTVSAPKLLGYAVAQNDSSTKSGTAPSVIVFQYEKDVVQVEVDLLDTEGGTVTAPIGYTLINEVPRKGNFTAFAPHVAGYLFDLECEQRAEFTNIETNEKVTFTYKLLSDYVGEQFLDITKIAYNVDSQTKMDEPETYTARRGTSFTIKPNYFEGYSVKSYEVNGGPEIEGKSYEVVNLEADVTIRFNYVPVIKRNLTVELIDITDGGNEPIGTRLIENLDEGEAYSYAIPDLTESKFKFERSEPSVDENGKTVSITIKAQENLLRLFYSHFDASGDVHHYDVDTNESIADSTSFTGKANTVYTAQPLPYNELSFPYLWVENPNDGTKDNQILISSEQEKNLIEFFYKDSRTVSDGALIVQHISKPDNGESLLIKTDTITYSEDDLEGGIFTYDPSIAQEVQSVLAQGYTLLTENVVQLDVNNAPRVVTIEYQPNDVPVTVYYFSESNQKNLETVKSKGFVGQLYAPAIKFFSGHIFSGLDPKTGLRLTKDQNYTRVLYRSTVQDAKVITQYMKESSDTVLGEFTQIVDLNSVVVIVAKDELVKDSVTYKLKSDNVLRLIASDHINYAKFIYGEDGPKTTSLKIKYLERATESVLQSEVVKELAIGTDYSHTAPSELTVGGVKYVRETGSQTIRLQEGKNEMLFYYSQAKADRATVRIQYIDNATKGLLQGKEVVNLVVGQEYYHTAPAEITVNNENYILATSAYKITLQKGVNEMPYYYNKSQQKGASVIIKYITKGTDQLLQTQEIQNLKAGESYSHSAPKVLTLNGVSYDRQTKPFTISLVKGKNEMVFYYIKHVTPSVTPPGEKPSGKIPGGNTGGGGSGGGSGGGNSETGGTIVPVVPSGGGAKAPAKKPAVPHTTISDIKIPHGFLKLEHVKYIYGYTDDTVRADSSVTRAEVAMILYLLLDDGAKHTPAQAQFGDVDDSHWYSQSINYLAKIGVVSGYKDGTFRPNATITRAEFAALITEFSKLEDVGINYFTDVQDDHWAVKYVNSAYIKGFIVGYGDSTFRPDNNLSRAELVSTINKAIGRTPNPETIDRHLNGRVLFSDLSPSHWAYYEIMEAAIDHDYDHDKNLR